MFSVAVVQSVSVVPGDEDYKTFYVGAGCWVAVKELKLSYHNGYI